MSAVSASVLRVGAEQAGSIRSAQQIQVALPESSVELPQAPYISPYISVDLNYDQAVLQIRDSDTGDVVQQFPTESRLAEIRRAKADLETRQLNSSQPVERKSARSETPVADSVKSQPVQVERKISSAPINVSADVITVQEATSAPPSNVSVTPQVAAAALSAGAKSGASASSGVSVLA